MENFNIYTGYFIYSNYTVESIQQNNFQNKFHSTSKKPVRDVFGGICSDAFLTDTGTRKIVRHRKTVTLYATNFHPSCNARIQNKLKTSLSRSCSKFPCRFHDNLRFAITYKFVIFCALTCGILSNKQFNRAPRGVKCHNFPVSVKTFLCFYAICSAPDFSKSFN